MRENGLKARQRRRFKRTTASLHAFPVAPNLLDQDFSAERPDEKWGADISYVWTREGWLYLAVVIDLFAIFFGLSFARSRRAQRQADAAASAAILGEPAPPAPKPVSRREFFRRSLVASVLVFSAEFGGATLAFLWPNLRGGFG